MKNATNQPLTDAQASRFSHVREGVTEHIVWQPLDDDKFMIPANDLTRDLLEQGIRANQLSVPMFEMLQLAFETLKERFSKEVKAFSPSVMHDGEFVISVRPYDNMFDIDLGLKLGDLADELEAFINQRIEETGVGVGGRLLVGFRQETGNANND